MFNIHIICLPPSSVDVAASFRLNQVSGYLSSPYLCQQDSNGECIWLTLIHTLPMSCLQPTHFQTSPTLMATSYSHPYTPTHGLRSTQKRQELAIHWIHLQEYHMACLSLTQGKTKVQNLQFSFYWMHFFFLQHCEVKISKAESR